MRISALAAIACGALLAGCSDPCRDLGDRLCECRPAGTTKASCTDAVRTDLQRNHPDGGAKSLCEHYLDTCSAPSGYELCDWIEGRCGKAACGMSEEDIRELQKPIDATTPACQADPGSADCAKICPGGPPSGSSSSSGGGASSSSSSSSGGGASSSSSSSSSGG